MKCVRTTVIEATVQRHFHTFIQIHFWGLQTFNPGCVSCGAFILKTPSWKHIVILHSSTAVLCRALRFSDSNITVFYFSVLDPSVPRCNHIFRWPWALWLSTPGWFCQPHNKSPWLSRPCFSHLSSFPGCLASAVGRRKTDLTPTTLEKVEQSHF